MTSSNNRAAWFLRSMANHDTHRGIYSPATRSVHAHCGVEFQPLPVGLHGDRIALPGRPPDPDQICPTCLHSGVTNP
jgi:hypothetical protein